MSQERAAILQEMRTIAARTTKARRTARNSQDAGYVAIVKKGIELNNRQLDDLKVRLADWPA
jgi:hypothetical protein